MVACLLWSPLAFFNDHAWLLNTVLALWVRLHSRAGLGTELVLDGLIEEADEVVGELVGVLQIGHVV